jgi:hypothetical protein
MKHQLISRYIRCYSLSSQDGKEQCNQDGTISESQSHCGLALVGGQDSVVCIMTDNVLYGSWFEPQWG